MPFPQPQLFPAAAGSQISISPSFAPPPQPRARCPAQPWEVFWGFWARGAARGTQSVGAQASTILPTLFTHHIPGLQEVVQG